MSVFNICVLSLGVIYVSYLLFLTFSHVRCSDCCLLPLFLTSILYLCFSHLFLISVPYVCLDSGSFDALDFDFSEPFPEDGCRSRRVSVRAETSGVIDAVMMTWDLALHGDITYSTR